MKFTKMLLTGLALAGVSASLLSSAPFCSAAETETELSGELNIATNFQGNENSGLIALANGFMELHPDVKINVDGPEDSLSGDSVKEYDKNLKVKILSGESPDLIYDLYGIYAELMIGSCLEDLTPYMENDPDYKAEDYFTEVIDLFESNGSIYAFPSSFSLYYQILNTDALEAAGADENKIDSVNYKTLLDTYSKAKENGCALTSIDYNAFAGKNILMELEMAEYIDFDNMTSSYDSEGFREYLESTKAYDVSGFNGFYVAEGYDPFKSEYGIEDKSYLSYRVEADIWSVPYLIDSYEGATSPYIETSSSGNVTSIDGGKFLIPKGSSNKGLAWEFIKYCTAESETVSAHGEKVGKWDGDRFIGDIPINRNNFKKYYLATYEYLGEEKLEKFFDLVDEGAAKCSLKSFSSYELLTSLKSILKDYYNDIIDEDTCVNNMQERCSMFFEELE